MYLSVRLNGFILAVWREFVRPNQRGFAFTITDDIDKAAVESVKSIHDRLIELGIKTTKGGSCIVYTHFANDLCTNGKIDKEFSRLMKIKILPKREGWFIPVSILLDHLRTQLSCNMNIDSRRLRQLEWKWLASKFAYVTS